MISAKAYYTKFLKQHSILLALKKKKNTFYTIRIISQHVLGKQNRIVPRRISSSSAGSSGTGIKARDWKLISAKFTSWNVLE